MRPWTSGSLIAAVLVIAGCASAPPRTASSYADFLVGRVANARQDHQVAADRYAQALARAPESAVFAEAALATALIAGDIANVRQAVRRVPREDAPGYANLVRAAEALESQRWSAAEAALENMEGAAGEALIGGMLRIWANTGQGRVDDVLMDLGPLASVRPYGAVFSYQQAMALDYAGRDEAALAAYQTAAQGGLMLPQAIVRHADLLVRRGERAQALELLSLGQNGQHPALQIARARLEAGQDAAPEALTPARGASAALYGLGAIFLQEADATNGFSTLTLSLLLDPDADASRLLFAQALSARGGAEEALAMTAAIDAASDYAGAARRLEVWILHDAGRDAEALSLARAQAAGGDVRGLRTLADLHRGLGQYGEAESIYDQLFDRTPNDWRLLFARGAARERLGRWPQAEADFLRALELSPEQPDVMNYLGYGWVDRGERLQEGLALIERAVALRPNSGAIIDSLGWAHFRLGNYAQARDLIEHALQLEPADATLNEHLGDVYWRLGRRIEARYQWQRALDLGPENLAAVQEKLANGLPPEPPRQAATR